MKKNLFFLLFLVTISPIFSTDFIKTISVVGKAELVIKPDTVVISTGVDSGDPIIGVALEQNKVIMNNIIEGLADLGIPSDNIETSNYNVYLYVPYNDSGKEEYKVSNSIKINISNLELVDTVIDTLITLGANKVNGIYFTFQNADLFTEELSKKAMENARKKAEFLAKLEGMKVLNVLSIEEELFKSLTEPRNYAYEISEVRSNSSLSPGLDTISLKYNVVYQIGSK